MDQLVRETTTTENSSRLVSNAATNASATSSQTLEYMIYFVFGVIEVLLAFRLILKLMGASVSSGFVNAIYSLSGIFTVPFQGIFSQGYTQGLETTSVLEPATIVALIVYVILAWGIVKLIRISTGEKQPAVV